MFVYSMTVMRGQAQAPLIHRGDKPTRTLKCPSYYFFAWSAIYFLMVSDETFAAVETK